MRPASLPSFVCVSACLAAAVFISGCGANNPAVSGVGVAEPELASVSGSVHGGAQPINNATVTLYAPATSGYGSAPTAIVTTTTNSSGSFTLPRPYACPTNSGDVYITATGGNSGVGSGANSAIALATLLGPCSALQASTQVKINEATTVAAAYTLAPFASVSTSGTGIGTSATNLVGLNNAYAVASNLVNPSTGVPNGATALSGMVLPTAEIDTLANILAACINTTTSSSSNCANLFTAATPPGGTAPVDTFQAALDIALNPGSSVPGLYTLASSFAVYQPALGTAPADFALGIQYTGGLLPNCVFTTGVAIDAQGDAWVGCGTDTANQGINEISPAGVFLSGSTGYLKGAMGTSGGNGIAIDKNGLVDVTAASQNAVFQLNASGSFVNKFTPSSLAGPTGVAVDNITGWIWIANTNNQPFLDEGSPDYTGTTVSALTAAGVDSKYSPYAPTLATGPVDIEIGSIDNIGTIFTANNTTNSLAAGIALIFAPSSSTPGSYNGGEEGVVSGGPLPNGQLAFDASNNLWFTSISDIIENPYISGEIWALGNSSVDISQTVTPISLMFDGLNRLFVANNGSASTPGSITVYTAAGTAISPATGYTANKTIVPQPYAPNGFDIDSSGNVWVTGNFYSGAAQAVVTELVGLAAPVATPKSVSSSNGKVAQRP